MTSGWVTARVPAHFKIRKSEMRRERITLNQGQDGSLSAVNGLGVDVRELWLADRDGRIYCARNLRAGASSILEPQPDMRARGIVEELRLAFAGSEWFRLAKWTESPGSLLMPGCYIAAVDSSPFIEDGLKDVGAMTRESVVYGIMQSGLALPPIVACRPATMRINVVNLKKHFGKTRAVDDISFSFAAGQVVGFVGPNGAGKTTTMRILATLDEPTEGDAYIDGISVVEEPEKARHLVGYVPDALPAHRDMSVRDYLDFFARAYGIKGSRRHQVIDGVEEFTNLAGIREKTLHALSKGMKQRVSLARSLS